MTDTLDSFDLLLEDREFWTEFEVALVRDLVPRFTEIFVAGAAAGSALASKAKAFPASLPEPLDPQAVIDAAEEAIRDYVPEFTKNISATTYNEIRTAVLSARSENTGVEGVIRDLRGIFSSGRAEMIGVTETTRLFGLGAQASYRIQGFNGWQWHSVNDPWVDPVCAGLNDQKFPMSTPFSPAHPRCLLPGTPVQSATAFAATRRVYEGEIITIRTSLGNQLSVTPNHPILTRRGWIGANEVREGDEVVSDTLLDPLCTPDNVQMPSLIQDVWEAFRVSLTMRSVTVPTSSEDFHGDGMESEVDIVFSDSFLLDRLSSPLIQQIEQVFFVTAHVAELRLSAERVPDLFIKPNPSPAHSRVSVSDLSNSSFRRPGQSLEPFGIAPASYGNVIGDKLSMNESTGDIQFQMDRILGGSSPIEFDDFLRNPRWVIDRVIGVSQEWVSFSHVYNLETLTGWYVAGGIVTHNCRCFPSPVVLPDAKGAAPVQEESILGGKYKTPEEFIKNATKKDLEKMYSVPGYRTDVYEVVKTDRPQTFLRVSMRIYKGNQHYARSTRYFEGTDVHHDLLVVENKFQGEGFARVFNERAEKAYREAGFKTVSVNADIDVGKYAWSKQGFTFQDVGGTGRYPVERIEQYRVQYRDWLVNREGMDRDLAELTSSERFQGVREAWDVASLTDGNLYPFTTYSTSGETTLGKALMLGGRNWEGVKYLDLDSDSQRIFRAYLESGKKKK